MTISEQVINLPTIDLRGLNPETETSWVSACKNVRNALEEYGCFIAFCNTVVSEDLQNQVLTCLKDLFGLSSEIKAKNISDKPLHGYFAKRPSSPLLESFGIDSPNSLKHVHDFADLMYPSQENSQFCDTIHKYGKITSEIEEMVTRMLFESYAIEKKKCENQVESTNYLLRVLQYTSPKSDETNMGTNAHTDKSFFTVIRQYQMGGLEIQTKSGVWVSVEFPPSSFFVMAGEACKAWSNGRVHSTVHQVKMRHTSIDEMIMMRYSLVSLSFIKGTIQVPEELVDEEHHLQFKPFDHYGLITFYAQNSSMNSVHSIEKFCGI